MGPTQLSLADVRPVGVAHDELWFAADFLWSRKSMKGNCCEVTHVPDGCVHIPGILICRNTHNTTQRRHSTPFKERPAQKCVLVVKFKMKDELLTGSSC